MYILLYIKYIFHIQKTHIENQIKTSLYYFVYFAVAGFSTIQSTINVIIPSKNLSKYDRKK